MPNLVQKQMATQQTMSAKPTNHGQASFGRGREISSILHLQQTIGNHAAQRFLKSKSGDLETGSARNTSFRLEVSPEEARSLLIELWTRLGEETRVAKSFKDIGTGKAKWSVVVREKPDKKSKKIAVLAKKAKPVPVTGLQGQWREVVVDGKKGFVKATAIKFTEADEARLPVLDPNRPFEKGGSELAEVRKLIEALPKGEREEHYLRLQEVTPYHSQRENEPVMTRGFTKEKWADMMCNITSLAMAFEYLGLRNPGSLDQDEFFSFDTLNKRQKKRANKVGLTAQIGQFEDYLDTLVFVFGWGNIASLPAWKNLAAHFGVKFEIIFSGGKKPNRNDWLNYRREYLAAGKAVTINVGGHIVRLQGVDEELGLIIDDPYGHTKLKTEPWVNKKNKLSWGNNWDAFNDRNENLVGSNSVCPWGDVTAHKFTHAFAWSGGTVQQGKAPAVPSVPQAPVQGPAGNESRKMSIVHSGTPRGR